MNRSSFILVLLFLTCWVDSFADSKLIKTVKVGIYVEDIYKIDYINSTYDIVFWMWVNSPDEFYDIQKYMDIVKSTDIKYNFNDKKKLKDGTFHEEVKITARILNQYDVRRFPFDVQNLKFNLELIKFTKRQCKIKFDKLNSKIVPEYIENWRKIKLKSNLTATSYDSNFGNTELKNTSSYNGYEFSIQLIRNQWSIFSKLFLTLFVSFFLASFSLFLPNKLSEEKIGLMLASLFASIGNKYITDDSLPIQDTLNLSDKLHILTIIFIALFAIYAIYEQRKNLKDSRRIDYILFFSTTGVYFFFVMLICLI